MQIAAHVRDKNLKLGPFLTYGAMRSQLATKKLKAGM